MCAVGAVKIVCAKVLVTSVLRTRGGEYVTDKLELLKLHWACVVRQPHSVAMMKHQ